MTKEQINALSSDVCAAEKQVNSAAVPRGQMSAAEREHWDRVQGRFQCGKAAIKEWQALPKTPTDADVREGRSRPYPPYTSQEEDQYRRMRENTENQNRNEFSWSEFRDDLVNHFQHNLPWLRPAGPMAPTRGIPGRAPIAIPRGGIFKPI